MMQTERNADRNGPERRRLVRALMLCFVALLCLGVGLGVANAKKHKHGSKASVSASAGKSAKGKTAKARTARKGSLAKARAQALAKAKAGTRRSRNVAVAVEPPSPPARDYFGVQKTPSPVAARAIGSYARGCLAGGQALPVDGPAWQAMRLSRNRNWGHPKLVAFVEKLANDSKTVDKWPGLLVGDMAQPMGGPMLSGHASHQIGLDADIWLKPMPDKTLSKDERENISAETVVADDQVSLKPDVWQAGHVTLLKRAASYPEVARIFVHPAIKKGLCQAAGEDRGWLHKVRPWWGHNYHFHVRLSCPAGTPDCEDQPATGEDDGCGKELEGWLKKVRPPAVVVTPKTPPVARKPMTMAQLPAECAKIVGYEPPPPVPVGPPVPERKTDAPKTAGQPANGSAKPEKGKS